MRNLEWIAVLLIFFSCSHDTRHEVVYPHSRNLESLIIIDITAEDFQKEVDFNRISEGNRYVPLSSAEVIVLSIDKVEVVGDRIFVLDRKANALHVFDFDGEYLQSFSSTSGVYNGSLRVGDFAIDETNGIIAIADKRNFLFQFDLKNYQYIRKVLPPDIRLRRILSSDSLIFVHSNLACSENNCLEFTVLDSDGKIVYQDLPVLNGLRNSSHYIPGLLSKAKEKIFISSVLNDTIYRFDNSLTPLFKFNFGASKLMINELESDRNLTEQIIEKSIDGRTQGVENFYVFEDQIYFEVFRWARLYRGFYDFESKETILGSTYITEDGAAFGQVVGSTGNALISWLSAEVLAGSKEVYREAFEKLENRDTTQFDRVMFDMSTEDNPVLIFTTI